MWTRKDLKDQAKAGLKRNYWKSVIIGFLVSLITAGTAASTSHSAGSDTLTEVFTTMSAGEILLALGVLFSGNYDPIHNSMIGGWAKEMGKKFVIDEVDPDASYPRAYNVLHSANALLNVGLNIAGNAAAIYNLATGTVKNDLPTKWN